MKIKTDYKSCSYITAGKEYEADRFEGSLYSIIDDVGEGMLAIVDKPCFHLDGIGTWELLEDTNES